MEDDTLLKIALACSVIGISALYIYSTGMSIPEHDIGSLGEDMLGNTITVSGRISGISDREGLRIIDITRDETIPVIVFSDIDMDISEGDFVTVTGELDEYNGRNEIIADNIARS